MEENTNKIWDVVVIGGGPAGMMAAGRAAERGASVLLLEKNPNVGKKLLITGGGRCNVTNAELDTRTFLEKYGKSNQYLFSAFSQWSVQETLYFFHARGMETKIEDNNRVFPVSDSAQSVWDVLVAYINEGNVTLRTNSEVTGFISEEENITGVKLKDNTVIQAHSYVLTTGGKSRPETGSTGEGFLWLETLGHNIAESDSSLVPIALNEKWISRLAGISLEEVKVSVYQNEKRLISKNGKILFTHVGLSGPTILNMSKEIGELLENDEVTISLDLFPAQDHGTLNFELQQLFLEHSNKQLKNALSTLLPSALTSVIISSMNISAETECNSVTRDARMELIHLLKNLKMSVQGLLGTDKAIVTSGGVSLDEVDFKTMSSRLFKNLYLAGDILDIDRPSGGFSLQLCWTTGYVAGNSTPIFSKE
jgi:predicted Rossmann fold flavoprotein